jgi:NDP-sugar pyrophosphorylase family protein
MKIIIPMAGHGKRYNDVAFHGPKPLIEIDGRPMIEHVVNNFDPDDEFIFICHKDHLATTRLKKVLSKLAKNYQILALNDEQIAGGPVYSASHAFPLIRDDEEVMVNYCDFILEWEYQDFLRTVHSHDAAGVMVSFIGFHPASLGDTNYCYMKVNDQGFITHVQEKQSYSNDRKKDYASTGTYYFRSGKLMKYYFKKLIDKKIQVNGEAYASLPYILMLEDQLQIKNYQVKKFICLGTPRDYESYKFWSEFFFKRSGQMISFNNVNLKTTNIFPIAGDKREFQDIGFDLPNYLLPIMDKPMINSTVLSYPRGTGNIFVCLEDHRKHQIENILPASLPDVKLHYLAKRTEGNALSIASTEGLMSPEEPVCISGCSYILDYDERKLSHVMEQDVDVILLSFTHHECLLRNSDKHSYLEINDGLVSRIVEKQTMSQQPYQDHAFTGTAIYKRASDLFDSIRKEVAKSGNPSFLTAINELIKEGKKVVVFEVDKFVSLLNSTDYLEFIYWQDYFDNLKYHPYKRMAN